MKKKMIKKLVLKKATVTRLDKKDMNLVIGATLVNPYYCSDSCSIVIFCCGDTTKPKLEMIALTLPGYCR